MTIETFYADAKDLIQKFEDFISDYNIGSKVLADHICFKCESFDVFEKMRALLEPESIFVYQSYISNRRIAIIKLKKAFETSVGLINILELSDQKPDNSQVTKFDHIELCPVDISYDSLIVHLQERGVSLEKIERAHHTTYDTLLENGYELKFTHEHLIEKIKRDEMI